MDIAVPAAARRLEIKARDAGWTVALHLARGLFNDRPIESVMLRLQRGAERVVAVWENGRFHAGWQKWTPTPPEGGVSPRRIGSRELVAVVIG